MIPITPNLFQAMKKIPSTKVMSIWTDKIRRGMAIRNYKHVYCVIIDPETVFCSPFGAEASFQGAWGWFDPGDIPNPVSFLKLPAESFPWEKQELIAPKLTAFLGTLETLPEAPIQQAPWEFFGACADCQKLEFDCDCYS